jgi:hypothetical protein
MNPAVLNNPFVQVALPIMFTILIATWINNKGLEGVNRRLDDLRSDMNNRFGEVNRRLDRIDDTLKTHSGQIAALEERVSPLGRR